MPPTKAPQQPHDDPPQIDDTDAPPDDSSSPHPDQLDLFDLLEGTTRWRPSARPSPPTTPTPRS